MCLHELLVKTDRHLPEFLKKTLLENEVTCDKQLCAVKNQADQMHAEIGRELTCDYNSLFRAAFFFYRTQGKAAETATSTAPIVAGTIKITIITRKTCKEVTTVKENNECQQ